MKFAGLSHRNICRCDLFDSGESDLEKIRGMLEQIPVKTLCVAWVLFLRTDDPYILKHYQSRNIAIFKAQLRNFVEPAERKIMTIRFRRGHQERFRAPEIRVDRSEVENWEKCLLKIESQISPENFTAIFKPLVFVGVEEGRGVIICPDNHHRKAISENYFDLVEGTMTSIFGVPVKLEFLLPDSEINQERAKKTLNLVGER